MLPTFIYEVSFAALYIFSVAGLTTDFSSLKAILISLLTCFGILFAFARTTVADRMQEAQARASTKTVQCYKWFTGYLIGGEICWLLVFLLSGNYVAMSSIPLFLAYPAWRRYYRRR